MTAQHILPWQEVQKRLRRIFPEGTPHHKDSTWDVAAKTVFVMLYLDAVKGASTGTDRILVKFPNGETRLMAPGPSSELSKHVVEIFAPAFLQGPEVIFLSESRDKVVARDEDLAKRIGLNILADKNLPDIILADLGPEDPLLVFIEVVASDGPVSEARKKALLLLTEKAGFPASNIRFVTAYFDRGAPQFKKTVDKLAWGTFAWFAAEPEQLMQMHDGGASLTSSSL